MANGTLVLITQENDAPAMYFALPFGKNMSVSRLGIIAMDMFANDIATRDDFEDMLREFRKTYVDGISPLAPIAEDSDLFMFSDGVLDISDFFTGIAYIRNLSGQAVKVNDWDGGSFIPDSGTLVIDKHFPHGTFDEVISECSDEDFCRGLWF